jgi:hydrogenase maturation protease
MTSHHKRRSAGDCRIVIIGTGNLYRGDDAVGVAFSRRIRESVPEGVTVLEMGGEPFSLMDAWAGADAVFLVDGVHTGRPSGASRPRSHGLSRDGSRAEAGRAGVSGRIHRFEAHREPLPADIFRHSTHTMGVTEAVEVARALGEMPPSLVVYGIRGDRFGHEAELSPEVDDACNEVVVRVLEDIRELGEGCD